MLDSDPLTLTQLTLFEEEAGTRDAVVPITPPITQPIPSAGTEEAIAKDPIITGQDFKMALAVKRYSVETSTIIMRKPERQPKKAVEKGVVPVPEPSNCTMEYLLINHKHMHSILKCDETKLTRFKTYPNQSGGRVPALKFVKGLEVNGLGRYSPNSDTFKRYNPDNEDCPDREGVKRKWQQLCLGD